jgi:hypothetical protein
MGHLRIGRAANGIMEMHEEIHPDVSPRRREDGVVRQLEFDGFRVVEEAATNIIVLEQAHGITEPWKYPSFIDSIVELQKTAAAASIARAGRGSVS